MLVIAIGAAAAALVVPFAFFPWSRTLWVAIDLAMRPLEFDDGVAPGFELEDDIEQVRRQDATRTGRLRREGPGAPSRRAPVSAR